MKTFILLVLFAACAFGGGGDSVNTGTSSQSASTEQLTALAQQLATTLNPPPEIINAIRLPMFSLGLRTGQYARNAGKSFAQVNTVMPTDPNVALTVENVDRFLTDLEDKRLASPFLSGSYPLNLGQSADDAKAIERLKGKIMQLRREIEVPPPEAPKSSLTEEEKTALNKLKTEIANIKTAAKVKPEPKGLKPMETLMYDMLYRRVKNVARAAEKRAPPKPQSASKTQEDLYRQLGVEMRKLQQATLRRPRNTSIREY